MIKRVSLIIICFCVLCGCTIEKQQVYKNVNKSCVKVNIAIFDEVPSKFETAVAQYNESHLNAEISVTRFPNDFKYRASIIEKITAGEISGFSVSGSSDIDYFSKDIADLPDNLSENLFEKKAYVIGVYGSGIFYNKQILKKMEIDPSSLKTREGLSSAVKLISSASKEVGLEDAVCTKTDLSNIAATKLKDGVPDITIQSILSFVGHQKKEDSYDDLSKGKVAFYFGSDRHLQNMYDENIAQDIDFCEIPYNEQSVFASDADYFCISKNASDAQKEVLINFLETLPEKEDYILTPFAKRVKTDTQKKLLGMYKNKSIKDGQLIQGYRKDFLEKTQQLRLLEKTWEEYCEDMKKTWKLNSE